MKLVEWFFREIKNSNLKWKNWNNIPIENYSFDIDDNKGLNVRVDNFKLDENLKYDIKK